MGIARHTAPKPAATKTETPKKSKKPKAKPGTGKWVQVNLRLAQEEYALFVTASSERGMTAPGLAKVLVDDYMREWGRPNNREEIRDPDTDKKEGAE